MQVPRQSKRLRAKESTFKLPTSLEEEQQYFEVKEVSYGSEGEKGLFAKVPLPKNSRLLKYTGRKITAAELRAQEHTLPERGASGQRAYSFLYLDERNRSGHFVE